jgi:hypothetical protein
MRGVDSRSRRSRDDGKHLSGSIVSAVAPGFIVGKAPVGRIAEARRAVVPGVAFRCVVVEPWQPVGRVEADGRVDDRPVVSRRVRNRRSATQNCRSLRTEYSAMRRVAFKSRSGGIDGRPVDAYIVSNTDDSFARASSESALMRRIGCAAGTRDSGDISINIDDCFLFSPRMGDLDHGAT